MTVVDDPIPFAEQRHIVLEDVSWEFYERLLDEIGDGATRVTFDHGRIEIMSPLSRHERWGNIVGRLIEYMCVERSLDIECLGSTTFRDQGKEVGFEPDECYYVKHVARARQIEGAFEPSIHPVPDLAIEIEITRKSLPREPIFATFGIPEVWRFSKNRLQVRLLQHGSYADSDQSLAFPFLPMKRFEEFVLRMREPDQLKVLREFREWVINLQ